MTMIKYESHKLRSGFYENKRTRKREQITIVIFCLLLGGAAWYSLTTTLDDMTRRDCLAGVQKACTALEQ
jgi:Zn-finger domain-containing protein